MITASATPEAMVRSIWRHRSLIITLARREVLGRYQGSIGGLFWSFINPLLMLGVYTFVFSVVFQSRWPQQAHGSKSEFALVLFAGLIPFNLLSECLVRSPGLIVANLNYVKKVVFPLEILPVVALMSALFHAMVSTLVWLVFYYCNFGMPYATLALLPLVFMPLMLLALGIGWALASLGVYIRDTAQVIGLVVTALMFMTPILYPIESVPEQYRAGLQVNPLTPIVEEVRAVMLWGRSPAWPRWFLGMLSGALVACVGFFWFQKTRRGFSDVL